MVALHNDENPHADVNGLHNGTSKPGQDVPHQTSLHQVSYPSNSLKFLRKIRQRDETCCTRLKILVIGAGIGGLAAAIALARTGHKVKLLEQASSLGEVGAGIQVPPNSARILQEWGLEHYLLDHVVEPENITFRRWQNGAAIGRTKLVPDFRKKYGAPYWVIHRAHLHEALARLAVDLGTVIELDQRVEKYLDDEGGVMLSGGRCEHADLVIAADGIKSSARQSIQLTDCSMPVSTGYAAYRATVPVNKIHEEPELQWLLQRPQLNTWIGHDKHVMTYTIASGKSFNMVLSHVDHTDPSEWTDRSAVDDMRHYFADWDPQLTRLIGMIDNTRKWPLMMGRKLQRWTSASGKLVILGDAAHAMLPYMSQGAAMAVEDAAALAEALSFVQDSGRLTQALNAFERVRLERTSQMQKASLVNGKLWHFADGPEQQARDQQMRAEVEGLPFDQSPNQWSDPLTQAWAYGYDAVARMREEMQQLLW